MSLGFSLIPSPNEDFGCVLVIGVWGFPLASLFLFARKRYDATYHQKVGYLEE